MLQTKTESQNGSEMIVTDTRYNALGLAQDQYAPYKLNNATTFWNFVSLNTAQPKTSTLYDALGRVVRVVAPDNTWVDTLYNGRQTAVLDAKGQQTVQAVDAFGRLVTTRQYSGAYAKDPPAPGWNDAAYATATYTYNVRDQLETVIGPDGAVTDPTYNLLGQKTQMIDPDLGTWTYAYDAAGNLVRQTDARGQTICFFYDGLNRLTGKTYQITTACPTSQPPTTAVSYTYDSTADGNKGVARRTGMIDQSGNTSWVYDARGRVTKETRTIAGVSYVTDTGYDSADRTTTLTYPADASNTREAVSHSYDAAMLLSQVRSTTNSANYVTGLTYNALGRISELTYGNNVLQERRGYYGLGGNWDSRPGAGLLAYGRLWRIQGANRCRRTAAGPPLQL